MLNLPWVRLMIVLPFFLACLTSCSKKDDVDLISGLIDKGVELAEAHNSRGLIKLTSADFRAMPGQHDPMGTRRILLMAFRHYGAFKVRHPKPRIQVEETGLEATGIIYFMIVKKERSYPELKELYTDPEAWIEKVGKNADLYRLRMGFVKTDGEWLVKDALLEPFKGF